MYYIYIIANQARVIYIGVTNNIARRVHEHQTSFNPGSFTARHHCHHLVYYEEFRRILDAMAREKQLKRWRRSKKVWLIERVNPRWQDLSEGW